MNVNAFRNLSYGVYIVSTLDGERATGCVANSVMQITSSPATIAVSMAIKKAKVLGKPIAKYDRVTGMTYLEYIDGRREIIE